MPPSTADQVHRKPETHRLRFYSNDYKRIKYANYSIKNSYLFKHLI